MPTISKKLHPKYSKFKAPHMMGMADFVRFAENHNPYRTGTRESNDYELGYTSAEKDLPNPYPLEHHHLDFIEKKDLPKRPRGRPKRFRFPKKQKVWGKGKK